MTRDEEKNVTRDRDWLLAEVARLTAMIEDGRRLAKDSYAAAVTMREARDAAEARDNALREALLALCDKWADVAWTGIPVEEVRALAGHEGGRTPEESR